MTHDNYYETVVNYNIVKHERRVDRFELRSRNGGEPASMPTNKHVKMSELVLELPDFENAACKGIGQDAFYDDEIQVDTEENTSNKPIQHAYLRRMCLTCPIVKECREYAINRETYGFWGGMTATERASERIMRGIVVDEIKYHIPITYTRDDGDRHDD